VTSADGSTVVFAAMPTTGPADLETAVALAEVRDVLPDNVYVTGLTAMTTDLNAQLSDTLPIFMGAVLVASFLLLMLVFRSVVVPLKAVVMNMLSIGAAYGVLVAVFQWGWGSSLIGLEGPDPDHLVDHRDHVPDPVRPVHGLRGVPHLADPRGVRADRRQHRGGRPRHGRDRAGSSPPAR
jgi:uncharacterized membrane protein YdfJ with MMPL/SSD domain